MRKVLVLGSAGFLMSNMMRYMLYRTKDFEFISLDSLASVSDHCRVYTHRKHSFHIGDAGDPELLERIMWVERPDIVVVATKTHSPGHSSHMANERSIVLPTIAVRDCCSTASKRPMVIRLLPDLDVEGHGDRAIWEYVESVVLGCGGMALRLPACFGRRGNGKFESEIGRMILHSCSGPISVGEPTRYAHADDVASMLWFLMESGRSGIVKMPALGLATMADMVGMAQNVLGAGNTIRYTGKMEESDVPGWLPDSKGLEEAVVGTTKWYMMNTWILKKTSLQPPSPGGQP